MSVPTPQISGALAGLRVVEPGDLEGYKRAVAESGRLGFAYYLPYLLAHSAANRRVLLIAEDEGSSCLYQWRSSREGPPRLDLMLAPVPMREAVLGRCLERANDFNQDRSARVLRIDGGDVELVSQLPQLRLEERKQQYLYAPKDFADIRGRRYRTLRRNVEQVQALAGLEVESYCESHLEGCKALLREWSTRHREAHGTRGGAGTTRRLIELAGSLPECDLRGEVVLIDGRLVAFAFGGEIRPGVACFAEAKSDAQISGLSYFHRYRFLCMLGAFELVNDGSDAGRPGLRQLKNSLRPVELHSEFRGFQS